ncbi:MAG: exodeoxyribonuclease VII large subunit [Reinekea sp.]|jgi:exodeoxyribonuclease VII large subunit
MFSNQPSAPLSVSQLNRQVKQLLETQYPAIPVQGEISTLSRPASGHIYFTLKDQGGQIRCAMFKGSLARNRYLPKQGDEVVAIGRLSLYEGRGDYQLIVNTLQPVGEGALQAAFFQLKERLDTEGLFAGQHKKTIPARIKTVGVVTSGTGAAFHDILTVLRRRYPALQVTLYPSAVQGDEAAATIVKAIESANRRNEVDVLIVGRGGGSLEDLWCFNTEVVARAIFASSIPIISAVGHEVDVSIADFVADQRAATPSQAAEMISPDQYDLMQQLDMREQRLRIAIQAILKEHQQSLTHLRKQLKSPEELVRQWQTNLGLLNQRLTRAIQQPIANRQQNLSHLQKRLYQSSPTRQLQERQQHLERLTKTLHKQIQTALTQSQSRFQQAIARLNVLSPLGTLERGYSITRSEAGKVIQRSSQLKKDDRIETLLKEGRIVSTVTEIKPSE